MDIREEKIIEYIKNAGDSSSKEVYDNAGTSVSYATLKRLLTKLLSENYLSSKGKGKGTKWKKRMIPTQQKRSYPFTFLHNWS